MNIVIELPYTGSVGFYLSLMRSKTIFFEKYENYRKGSYRNRCHIQNANGMLALSLPLVKGKNQHIPMKDVKICYDQNWQKMHWVGLTSSYRRSPFFEYYEDLIYPFYHKEIPYLIDFNEQLFEVISKMLNISFSYSFTEKYEEKITLEQKNILDYRSIHHPNEAKSSIGFQFLPYLQVFSDRMAFMEDLSILDLIFNKGPRSAQYLNECLKLNN